MGAAPTVLLRHDYKTTPTELSIRSGLLLKGIPSGKRLQKTGKSPCFMGKSTISTGPCSSSQIVCLPEAKPMVLVVSQPTWQWKTPVSQCEMNCWYVGIPLSCYAAAKKRQLATVLYQY